MGLDEGVLRGLGFGVVGGFGECEAQLVAQRDTNLSGKLGMGVDARCRRPVPPIGIFSSNRFNAARTYRGIVGLRSVARKTWPTRIGVASIRRVRPILTILSHSFALASKSHASAARQE